MSDGEPDGERADGEHAGGERRRRRSSRGRTPTAIAVVGAAAAVAAVVVARTAKARWATTPPRANGHAENGHAERHAVRSWDQAAAPETPMDGQPVEQMQDGHMPVERAPYEPAPAETSYAPPPARDGAATGTGRCFRAAAGAVAPEPPPPPADRADDFRRCAAGEAQARLVASLTDHLNAH